MQQADDLYHVSEEAGTKLFAPRPLALYFEAVTGDLDFAISDKLLLNYLLPRNCQPVTFYAGEQTTQADRCRFIGPSKDTLVITPFEAGLPYLLFCKQCVNYFSGLNSSETLWR